MNAKLILAVGGAFVAGASSAFFAVRGYFKKKYSDISEQEISEVRAAYDKALKDLYGEEEKPKETKKAKEEPVVVSPVKDIRVAEETIASQYNTVSEVINSEPEIISSSEYGTYDDYDMIDLTYYPKEKILLDDLDHRLQADKTVGKHNLDPFHHPDADGRVPDVIYIRDDEKACYYEVDRCDEPYYGPEKEE